MRVPHLIYQVPTSLIRSTTQYNASISPVAVHAAPVSSSYASMQTSTNIAELYVGLQAVLTSAAASLQEQRSDAHHSRQPDSSLTRQQELEPPHQCQEPPSPQPDGDDAPMQIVITAPSSQSLPQKSPPVVISTENASHSSDQSESVSENCPPCNTLESTKPSQAARPKSRPQSSKSGTQHPTAPQPYKPGNGPRLYDKVSRCFSYICPVNCNF